MNKETRSAVLTSLLVVGSLPLLQREPPSFPPVVEASQGFQQEWNWECHWEDWGNPVQVCSQKEPTEKFPWQRQSWRREWAGLEK